jgi:peptidoglycan hydrolase CwlO-like protein
VRILQKQVTNLNEDIEQRDASIVMLGNKNEEFRMIVENLKAEVKSSAEKLKVFKQRLEALRNDL